MPARTPEERAAIDSLEIKKADEKCNARLAKTDTEGNVYAKYCGNSAGYGTDHLGVGRCKYHGGSSPGAPATVGSMYSKYVERTLSEEIERIATDPNFLNLYEEFAIMKASLGDILKKCMPGMGDTDENFWIGTKPTQFGDLKVVSPEATVLLKILENMGKLYERIVKAEKDMAETLSPRTMQMVLTQIKKNVNDNCGVCPVRNKLRNGLDSITIASKG